MSAALADIVGAAAADEALARDVERQYESLAERIASHGPTCWNRGECCRFGAFGHRLYVTTVELGFFVRGMRDRWLPPTAGADACPYQRGGVCTAREARPMGCRVFYCDSAAQSWQNEEYERQLVDLKQLGEAHGVEYRYVEWLSALAEISAAMPEFAGKTGDSEQTPRDCNSIDPAAGRVIELTQVRPSDSHR